MSDGGLLKAGDAFAEVGRIDLGETDLDGVLQHVASVAKRTIPHADEVSVTLTRDNRAYTAAFTGDLALACDERQYVTGHGPCLDASAGLTTLTVPDFGREDRWPDYIPQAISAGARSSLSIGLPVDDSVAGALNVYATEPGAFDDDAVALAQAFAGYAAAAVSNAYIYDSQVTLAQHMQRAMASRAVIEQAKGIIMGDRRCTADEAFTILKKLSQDTNRKLREVAAALVDSAQGQGRAG